MSKYTCQFNTTKSGNNSCSIVAKNQEQAVILAKSYLESDYAKKNFGYISEVKLKVN